MEMAKLRHIHAYCGMPVWWTFFIKQQEQKLNFNLKELKINFKRIRS